MKIGCKNFLCYTCRDLLLYYETPEALQILCITPYPKLLPILLGETPTERGDRWCIYDLGHVILHFIDQGTLERYRLDNLFEGAQEESACDLKEWYVKLKGQKERNCPMTKTEIFTALLEQRRAYYDGHKLTAPSAVGDLRDAGINVHLTRNGKIQVEDLEIDIKELTRLFELVSWEIR